MFSAEIETELITKAVSGNRDALQELLLARSGHLSRHVASKMPPSLKGDISVEFIAADETKGPGVRLKHRTRDKQPKK